MDNHPIPQDVTGFQFKLVGSMTIKQFAYVGAGVILAVVFFYSPLAWYIKYPLIVIPAALGVSLAFLPIAGRPLDLMASNFVKAVLRPNQYVYQKNGGSLSFMELNLQPVLPKPTISTSASQKGPQSDHKKEEQLLSYLYGTPQSSVSPLDQKEDQLITSLFNQPTSLPPYNPTSPTPASTQPTPPPPPAIQQPTPPPTPPLKPEILPEIDMQPVAPPTVLEVVAPSSVKPVINTTPPQPQAQLTTDNSKGMEFPNIIKGTIRDSRNNMLPGILVEVLNKDKESVRAFKTNSLGQFVSATQLADGPYTITFEDPKAQHKFESVNIEANGGILPPLNIISVDAREELRRSLFT